ncbi:MAG: hypothetical protein AABW54_04100 [Candidatus Micrarchaeota archaeon]
MPPIQSLQSIRPLLPIRLPREINKFYAGLRKESKPEITRLKQLDEKKILSAGEKREVRSLLGTIAFRTSLAADSAQEDFSDGRRPASAEKNIRAFEKLFGHAPTCLSGLDHKPAASCFSNVLAQNLVLEEFGESRVGVLWFYAHGVPTVKIGGETFVLEQYRSAEEAQTLREYLKQVKTAYYDPAHRHHEKFARVFTKNPREFEEQLRKARLFTGLRHGLAGAHTNLALHLHNLGFKELAEKHFREAAELAHGNWTARFNHAVCLGYLGRWKESTALLERLAREQPDSKIANDVLAWTRRHDE